MCPLDGHNDFFNSKSRNYYGSFLALLDAQYDFSISKMSKVVRQELVEKLGREPYKIEDVPPHVIYKFVENQMESATSRNTNSIKAEEKSYRRERVFKDEEDGKIIQASEIAVDEDKGKFLTYYERKDKLALIVKKLHNKGKRFKTHMMSLIISYERAKANDPTITKCSFRHVGETTFVANDKGDPMASAQGGYATIRNDGGAVRAIAFLNGEEPEDSAYKAYKELLWLCYEEDIDLTKENPLNYTSKFIESLIIRRVTKNREYLNRRFSPDMAERLRHVSISEYKTVNTTTNKIRKSRPEIIENKILQFQTATEAKFIIETRGSDRRIFQEYIGLYAKLFGRDKFFITSRYDSYNDILVDKNGKYLEIEVLHLLPVEVTARSVKAIVNVKGYFILIDNYEYEDDLKYLPIERAIEYMTLLIEQMSGKYNTSQIERAVDYEKGKISYSSVSGNYTYGKWDSI